MTRLWKTTLWLAALAAVLASAPAPLSAQILEAELTVKGLACPFCAYGLERKLKKLPAAAGVTITFKQNLARVHFDGNESPELGRFFQVVRDAGFKLDELRLLVRGKRSDAGGRPCLELPDGKLLPFAPDGAGADLVREAPPGTPVEARAAVRPAGADGGAPSYLLYIDSFQALAR